MSTSRSEDMLGTKVDRCVADSVLKLSGGAALGVVASFVLLRRRTWPVWFGAGLGLGMGLGNCQHDLASPSLLHGRKVPASSAPPPDKDHAILVQKSPDKTIQK